MLSPAYTPCSMKPHSSQRAMRKQGKGAGAQSANHGKAKQPLHQKVSGAVAADSATASQSAVKFKDRAASVSAAAKETTSRPLSGGPKGVHHHGNSGFAAGQPLQYTPAGIRSSRNLSKSVESLSGVVRRKAQSAIKQRPMSWVGPDKDQQLGGALHSPNPGNKPLGKSVNFADLDDEVLSPLTNGHHRGPTAPVSTDPLRKAASVQSLDKASVGNSGGVLGVVGDSAGPEAGGGGRRGRGGAPIRHAAGGGDLVKAESIQNLCRPTASSLQKATGRVNRSASATATDSATTTASAVTTAFGSSKTAAGGTPSSIPRRVLSPSNMAGSHSHAGQSSSSNMKKSSSIQNINRTPLSVLRRVSSTQNVARDTTRSTVRHHRTVAPPSAMAYNAELLASFDKEKKVLEARISELIQITETRKGEIEKHKIEIKKQTRRAVSARQAREQLELSVSENRMLRERLQELGVSVEQTTDNDKISQLQKAAQSASQDNLYGAEGSEGGGGADMRAGGMSSSRRSDSSGNLLDDCDSVQDFPYGTPDHPSVFSGGMDNNWDKQSTKSSDGLSEISVACLQDRILQMEETHYSTNEELQATLQELCDLQRSVNQLSDENEDLGAERNVLLEALCAQTVKLENARTQIEHLKALLLTDSEHSQTEREQQLVNLLRGAQEEREELILKQYELTNVLQSLDGECKDRQEEVVGLKDTSKQLEEKSMRLEDVLSHEQIELERYKTLLENEKSKVEKLHQLHKAADKSELEELLESTRGEKEAAEKRCAYLTESLGHSQCEVTKMRNQLVVMEQELTESRVAEETAMSQGSLRSPDLLLRYEKSEEEKQSLENSCASLRSDVEHLKKEAGKQADELKSAKITISDLQAELKGAKHRYTEFEKEMETLGQRHSEEAQEWRQFQSDLQTAVVIANEIKSETECNVGKLADEKAELTEQFEELQQKFSVLESELKQMKVTSPKGGPSTFLPSGEIKKRLMNNVDREIASIRQQGRRISDIRASANNSSNSSQNMSVKTLIRSIEGGPGSSRGSSQESSRRGSTDNGIGGATSPNSLTNGAVGGASSIESPRRSPERRMSLTQMSDGPNGVANANTPPLKSALKKSSVGSSAGVVLTPADHSEKMRHHSSSLLSGGGDAATKMSSRLSLGVAPTDVDKVDTDPLGYLVKQTGGSKRNALLKWCKQMTIGYPQVDITNFSSSWNDGLAFCALLHCYLPHEIPIDSLCNDDKRRNFLTAFTAAEKEGIQSNLNVNDMVSIERPDWQLVMQYVTSIYKHFEC